MFSRAFKGFFLSFSCVDGIAPKKTEILTGSEVKQIVITIFFFVLTQFYYGIHIIWNKKIHHTWQKLTGLWRHSDQEPVVHWWWISTGVSSIPVLADVVSAMTFSCCLTLYDHLLLRSVRRRSPGDSGVSFRRGSDWNYFRMARILIHGVFAVECMASGSILMAAAVLFLLS